MSCYLITIQRIKYRVSALVRDKHVSRAIDIYLTSVEDIAPDLMVDCLVSDCAVASGQFV
eukprot:m.215224 g.215224  ORF g.215224 m.215224 type:complete len:60 (+) comp19085_c1_seq1:163-342(+)